jgi:hypothetical protein
MQVSEIILLIISVMPAQVEPSGFASTEVGAETSMVFTENDVSSTTEDPRKTEPPAIYKEMEDRKMPAKPSCASQDKGDDRNHDVTKMSMIEVQSDRKAPQEETGTVASRESFTQVNYSDSSDSAVSSDSRLSYTNSKRKATEDTHENRLPDRIPKRQKYIKVMPPMRDSSHTSYSSKMMNVNDGYTGPFATTESTRIKAIGYYNPEECKSDISLKELLVRHSYWSQVLSYKPDSRCIPLETYLVVAVTCSGLDDSPYVLRKFEGEEAVIKDKDLKAFLSIEKLILIERPVGGCSMYYYCIPNLHKWMHGTLHIKSIQDRYFKTAINHITDLVTIRCGDHYKDQDLGIQIRYRDRLSYNEPSLRNMIPYVAQLMDPSSGTTRKVPCISWGWSTANPNEH